VLVAPLTAPVAITLRKPVESFAEALERTWVSGCG
jgi:hypothetical protein